METDVFKCSFCGNRWDNMVCCLASTHNDNPCTEPPKVCETCEKGTKICGDCATRIFEADK